MLRIAIALICLAAHPILAGNFPRPGQELFTNGPVLRLSLKIAPPEMESLRKDPRKSVRATLVENGAQSYEEVAVHIKGAAGSSRPVDDRPAFTVDLNQFRDKQKFHGLSKIHLNNSVQDPAMLDEALCGELFREAGVPAARATHAIFDLNGKPLGIYVVKEGFTRQFLSQYFAKTDGNIYDPGFLADVSENAPRGLGKKMSEHEGLKELVEATRISNEAKRWERLNQILDVERFINMAVLEVFTVHWDGYSFQKNNYKLYLNPEDHRFTFFVHGMDQMFGRGGDPAMGLEPPMNGIVAQAIFSTKEGRMRYYNRLQSLHDQLFTFPKLKARTEVLAAPVRLALKDHPDELNRYNGEVNALIERLRFREEQVARHLRDRKAYHP